MIRGAERLRCAEFCDAAGNVVQQTDRDGRVTQYVYDADKR